MASGPADEDPTRAEARRATLAAREADDRRISRLRLVTLGVGVALAVLAWRGLASGFWLLLPVAAFVVLVRRHDRAIRARDAAGRAVAFYERGLARIEDRWIGTGATGERFLDDDHPYAADLDLFGRGSLFELLSLARTHAGEEAIAGWLTRPSAARDILERHDALRELTGDLDLREALSLAGNDALAVVDSADLLAWSEAAPRIEPWRQWAAVALTAALAATAALVYASEIYVPLFASLAAQGWFRMLQRSRIDAVLHGAETRARDLATLLTLLERIETHAFRSPRLVALQQQIGTAPGLRSAELSASASPRGSRSYGETSPERKREGGQLGQEGSPDPGPRAPNTGVRASAVIRRLLGLIEAHDWEHNLAFTPVALALMWSTHVAGAVERWRARHGRQIGAWLDAIGEIEALSSLSAYRYEHPDDPFPEIVAPGAGEGSRAIFDGVGLGHPLLPSARMVANDVHFSSGCGLLLVSGSNMSGKSTLLRTVGVNAVLALAGAPVRAASLRLTPVDIGATLRIQDSLQEGRSRFYAEITRVRHIVDLARGPRPVLFLLDELFHGTNSHDRLAGASGVLRGLVDLGAIGLVTTHDLALTEVVNRLAPRARNVHFEDRFEGGEMLFDYLMKPGPVTRSNALALMRAVGLEVEGD